MGKRVILREEVCGEGTCTYTRMINFNNFLIFLKWFFCDFQIVTLEWVSGEEVERLT